MNGPTLTARLELRHRTAADMVSYQVLDPDTGTPVLEGPRTSLPPGEFFELPVELPAEPGRYLVYVSPLQDNVAWDYALGEPFLLLDAEVEAGEARLISSRVTTLGALRRERLARSLRRALWLPFALPWRHRGLIRSLARRDIAGRYRGSFGGLFWTVLHPLLLMATYFFVFGLVLRTRFGNDPSRAGFVLYFLCGMLPWLAFSEAAGRAPSVIAEHRNFVKRLVFPLEILPVNLAASGLATELFALAIFLPFVALARGGVPWTFLWLPLLILPQVLFTLGIAWLLAALGVYARDLGQITGFLLTLWFFITPICYPVESLPAAALPLLSRNPLWILVDAYRRIFLESRPPAWEPLAELALISLLMFLLGHACFHKLRKNFADVI